LSGYSAWKKNRSLRESLASELDERICIIFHDNTGKYGAERICGVIREGGGKASFRKVRDIMNRLGLHSIHEKRRTRLFLRRDPVEKLLSYAVKDLRHLSNGMAYFEGMRFLSATQSGTSSMPPPCKDYGLFFFFRASFA
jgi:hypothetical protein